MRSRTSSPRSLSPVPHRCPRTPKEALSPYPCIPRFCLAPFLSRPRPKVVPLAEKPGRRPGSLRGRGRPRSRGQSRGCPKLGVSGPQSRDDWRPAFSTPHGHLEADGSNTDLISAVERSERRGQRGPRGEAEHSGLASRQPGEATATLTTNEPNTPTRSDGQAG